MDFFEKGRQINEDVWLIHIVNMSTIAMENHKDSAVVSNRGRDLNLNDEQASRSVVISNIPANAERAKLHIHFQKKGNGGGEIESLELLDDGRAILTYEEAKGLCESRLRLYCVVDLSHNAYFVKLTSG